MTKPRYLIQLLCGLFLFSSVAMAETEDGNEAQDPERTDRETLIDQSCREEPFRHGTWLDRTHSYINERLCEPAAWFDGFFGDPRSFEETPVGTFFRFRNELSWDEGSDDYRFRMRLAANLTLPRASDRLRLLVFRDEDVRGEFDEERRTEASETRTRLGLRYLLREMEKSRFDLDATVRARWGELNPIVQGRYRIVEALTDYSQARYTQLVYWDGDDGWATTSRVDLEWFPNRRTQLRWTADSTFSETSSGVDWSTALVGFHQIDLRSAISSAVGVNGHTRPSYKTDEYYINFRYRRNFLRSWLYYEVQPERAWPRLEDGRQSVWRLIVRIEVQFENQSARVERLRKESAPSFQDNRPPSITEGEPLLTPDPEDDGENGDGESDGEASSTP